MITESIKKVVYEILHNQPYGTDMLIDTKVHKIWIPDEFRKRSSKPSRNKMIARRQEYMKLGHLDKPIEVDMVKDGEGNIISITLVDKYTRYLTIKEFGMDIIPIKINKLRIITHTYNNHVTK